MKYIIATHGKMASGIKNTIEMLVGKREDIYTIDAYIEDQDLAGKFENLLSLFKGEYIYVFTDVVSGSVNQTISGFLGSGRIRLITGINLPVIMELILRNEELSDDEIVAIVEEAKEHLIYVNKLCSREGDM